MTDHHVPAPDVAPIPAVPRPHGRWRTAVRASLAAAAATGLVAGLIAFGGSAQAATLFSDDFEDGNSTGWTPSGGTWSVATDGSRVLRQAGTSSDARARAGQASWTNYTVTTRVKPTAVNGTNRFVAVLARAQSNTSYYYLALRTNNTVELKKLVGGSATTLASAPVTVTLGTWYTLQPARSAGTTLRGSVNGGTPLQATDSQFAAGGIGVATFNAAANFDDVLVDSGTGPTPPVTSTTTDRPTTPPVTTTTTTRPPTTDDHRPRSRRCPTWPTASPRSTRSGQNGTSGGAGGPIVTVSTTQQLLDAIDTIGTMVIQVQGTINITSKQGVRPNKTIIGVGSNADHQRWRVRLLPVLQRHRPEPDLHQRRGRRHQRRPGLAPRLDRPQHVPRRRSTARSTSCAARTT